METLTDLDLNSPDPPISDLRPTHMFNFTRFTAKVTRFNLSEKEIHLKEFIR